MKRKKISRMYLFLVMSGVFVTIIAMSVVYAALSSKLLINGNAEVQASSFGIKLEKLSVNEYFGDSYNYFCAGDFFTCNDNFITYGSASMDSVPTITNNSINNFKFSVTVPGDMVIVFYKVTNTGSIPVTLHDVVASEFVYTSFNNSEDDLLWAENYLNYDVILLKMSDESKFLKNDTLCPGETLAFFVGLEIPNDVDTLPSGGLEISNPGVSFDFVQTDQIMCER